ncbi:DUF4136 domain-containing protein [Acidipila rosea]|uniref:Uncharacterized protein DUF4136 n=1 Tax=Acidipila rosea TaxID=768535 RepID=A0A4R1L6K7_9BACT|nr:DUF4136 domain-containing protein [Acidipila rosea]TCK73774.1 uncharacterized protein DUF4136 [Acidipila rosea]
MKRSFKVAAVTVAAFLLMVLPLAKAHADDIKTDYDHHANFQSYNTFSFGKIDAKSPFDAGRIKRAVTTLLQQRGWREVPTGGQATVFATQNVHNEKEAETMYDGMGGGWGMGWGWGGWGMGPGGGMGEATTSTVNQRVDHLMVDMFDSSSKKLLWRGVATGDISNNSKKNKKSLYGDIHKMFDKFPVKPQKS